MAIIKYVIADDHKIFRKGIRISLDDDPSLELIGEAGDGIELLALLEKQIPDVVLLDINMPNMDGMKALVELKKKYASVKTLILSMHDDEQLIVHLMELGANGYLLKNAEPEEIKAAIHTVHECAYYFNELVSASLLKKVMQKGKIKPKLNVDAKLNESELKVLMLICAEKTSVEIAKEIFLSIKTIEGIRSALLEKTGARNTAGLVLYAVKNGVVV